MAAKNDPSGLSRVSAKERTTYHGGGKVEMKRGPVRNPNDGKSNGGGINRPTRRPSGL